MAERKFSEFSSNFKAVWAPFLLLILNCSSRDSLLEINATSDKAKKPLIRISMVIINISIVFVMCGEDTIF
jgi:hypothetical protein